MVTRTISPFELQPIRSLWDQYAPGNFLNNFPSLWDIGPGIVVLVGTVAWADWYFEVLGRHHGPGVGGVPQRPMVRPPAPGPVGR